MTALIAWPGFDSSRTEPQGAKQIAAPAEPRTPNMHRAKPIAHTECEWKHGDSGKLGGRKNLVQQNQNRIHLTPTGLLMEGDFTHWELAGEGPSTLRSLPETLFPYWLSKLSIRPILQSDWVRAKNTLERAMKNVQTRLAVLLLSTLCFLTGAYGQITPLGDAYINTSAPTTNYGAKTTLDVGSTQTTFIQFNLLSIPATYTSADITQATLKLYVIAVPTAGSFNVDYVNGTSAESTIDASNAPALGTTIAASVSLVTADKNQYILVNVTAAVQAWLSGTPNDGIALVANSPLSATFDSKETTTTSHPPELDLVFAGGGTLTGITTASGSGLTGGGTSGTLNLSLSNACSANQVLQWNGTAWVCAAVGTGTVTSVGSGTGLTGGPITGSGTLSISPNACAYGSAISALPFTCFPFAVLGANTFTASQTITGNLTVNGEGGGNITASAAVSGSSYSIGSNLFAYGFYTNANAFLGFAGNTTMTGNSRHLTQQHRQRLSVAPLQHHGQRQHRQRLSGARV